MVKVLSVLGFTVHVCILTAHHIVVGIGYAVSLYCTIKFINSLLLNYLAIMKKQTEYNTIFNVFYDSDEMLYYTKVGLLKPVNGICPLHYTVWGITREECRLRAEELVSLLKVS